MQQKLERKSVAVGKVRENPKNPRKHPPKQMEALVAAIREFGQVRPILVRKANMMIIAGHGVFRACQKAGMPRVDIELWDVDQRTADLFMAGDNRLAELGETDRHKLTSLFNELKPENYLSLGFTVADIDSLLGQQAEQADEQLIEMVEAGDIQDFFWISIRGPMRDQALALQRLRQAMADLSDVDVTMGTRLDVA